MIKTISNASAALLLATACAQTPEPADENNVPEEPQAAELGDASATEPDVDDRPDECGAGAVQSYIGQEGTEAIEAELEAKASGRFRWIPPGTIVTDDYGPSRMNVMLDDEGVIVKIDCG